MFKICSKVSVTTKENGNRQIMLEARLKVGRGGLFSVVSITLSILSVNMFLTLSGNRISGLHTLCYVIDMYVAEWNQIFKKQKRSLGEGISFRIKRFELCLEGMFVDYYDHLTNVIRPVRCVH